VISGGNRYADSIYAVKELFVVLIEVNSDFLCNLLASLPITIHYTEEVSPMNTSEFLSVELSQVPHPNYTYANIPNH
jgi:hypothetical protein